MELIKKLDLKLLSASLIASILFHLIGAIVVDSLLHPLSRQDVFKTMKEKNVVAHGEERGVLIFITESDYGHKPYVFSEAVFLERFRMHTQMGYGDANVPLLISVTGKRHYYILTAYGTDAQLVMGRLRTPDLSTTLWILMSLPALVYYIYAIVKSRKDKSNL
jgi:hypothetical protein